MKSIGNDDNLEQCCYLEIIEYFNERTINQEEKEIWKNHILIELMNFLNQTNNRKLVTNAIILLLSLSEDNPLDIYSDRGTNINQIVDKDKKLLIQNLKEELLHN